MKWLGEGIALVCGVRLDGGGTQAQRGADAPNREAEQLRIHAYRSA